MTRRSVLHQTGNGVGLGPNCRVKELPRMFGEMPHNIAHGPAQSRAGHGEEIRAL
ncbi:MAG: hypothetical protein NVS3B20_16750 [Polyangiales bacterium]